MERVEIITKSTKETEALAARMAQNLRGGELIELVSDLGGGKTTFTRGLAAGLGSKDQVGSPTFTISREYHGGRLTVHHFDFYRLAEPGIIADELAEIAEDKQAVVVVEWPAIVQHVLPEKRLTLTLHALTESSRRLEVQFPASLSYVTENV